MSELTGTRGLVVGQIGDTSTGDSHPFSLMILRGDEGPDDRVSWIHWETRWQMLRVGLGICRHALTKKWPA